MSAIREHDAEYERLDDLKYSKERVEESKRKLRHKISHVKRQKQLLQQVLGSLNFGQISIDQILLLKRCDFYE